MAKLENIVERLAKSPLSGLVVAALCGLFFTINNFMAQLSIETNRKDILPAVEIVFIRSIVQLVLLTPIILSFRLDIRVPRSHLLPLLFMSTAGFASIVFVYIALEKIPVSDALVITFTSPVFTAVFAYVILKEKSNWFDIACGIISFIGVVIVARPTFIFGRQAVKQILPVRETSLSSKTSEMIYLIGAGYALLGGVSLALYFVLTRKFANEGRGILNVFYPTLIGLLFSPIIGAINGDRFVLPDSLKSILCVVSVGVFSFLGLGCLTLALKLETATYVTVVRNLDIVYSFILQYVGLGIAPSLWSIGGGLVIMVATTCMAVRKQCLVSGRFDRNEYTEIEGESGKVEAPVVNNDVVINVPS